MTQQPCIQRTVLRARCIIQSAAKLNKIGGHGQIFKNIGVKGDFGGSPPKVPKSVFANEHCSPNSLK